MKTKLLLFVSIVLLVVLAPSTGRYYENSLVLPKLSLSPTFGQSVETGSSETGVVWDGGHGITETVDQIMQRERDNPTHWDGNYRLPKEEDNEDFIMPTPHDNPDAPAISQWPPAENNRGQNNTQHMNPQTVGVKFDGPQINETVGYIPPDNNGAVGPTQIVITSNGRLKVYDKTGVVGALNTTTDNFFASVRSAGTSDTHVRYDRLSQRWYLVVIDVATPNRVLLAVSSGPTITGTASFTFFFFQHDLVGPTPNSDTGGFADYPTLGVDKFALYTGVNVFNAAGTAYLGSTAFVINKANLMSGTLTVTAFRQVATSSGVGLYTPQGVDNDSPSATEGYFIAVDGNVYSKLQIRRISTPGGTPTISGNISITTPTTYGPIGQPCNGTSTTLDALDHRLFAAQLKTNTVTGVSSLWTAHNIRVNSSGVAGASGNRNAARWYEIINMTTSPAINQSGTLFDVAASTPRGFWIPSVAMSGQGHMALISSTAGSNLKAEISIAGRLSSDAGGTIQAFTLAQATTFSYDITVTNPQRWGDFSQVVVDPTDNMTMWSFEQYCNASNSWCVKCIQMKAPPPATPTTATNVTQGLASVNTSISGTVVSGSGFYDPGSDAGGPGFTNHISVSVSGGVVVNSVTFNSATSLTVNVNTVSAPIGLKDVTVTNPDGQVLTGVKILSVDAPSPVTMLNFNAGILDNNNVQLSWETAIEVNNSGFDIERSIKGSNSWSKIGFVQGFGNSNQQHDYSFTDRKLNVGKYDYRLKQTDYNGNFEYFNLDNYVTIGIPDKFVVSQSYPNPSNPKSKIDYQMPFSGKVSIKVYDLTGKEVTTLVNETKDSGYYSVDFDGTNLASGIYIYRVEAQDASTSLSITKTMKMVLVK